MTRVTNFNIYSAKVFVITTADAVVKYYNIRSIYNTNEKCENIFEIWIKRESERCECHFLTARISSKFQTIYLIQFNYNTIM